MFNLEDATDAEVLEQLKAYVASLPVHEQIKFFDLTTEEVRDSLLSPGQKIANCLEEVSVIPYEEAVSNTEVSFTVRPRRSN